MSRKSGTNVREVATDAVEQAAHRVEQARNELRKLGNMRAWALSDEQRREVIQAIGEAYQDMSDTILNTPKAERQPFSFRS